METQIASNGPQLSAIPEKSNGEHIIPSKCIHSIANYLTPSNAFFKKVLLCMFVN